MWQTVLPLVLVAVALCVALCFSIESERRRIMERDVLDELGLSSWSDIEYIDFKVGVRSRDALDKYDYIKFFKENEAALLLALGQAEYKEKYFRKIESFLRSNTYADYYQYGVITKKLNKVRDNAQYYRVEVQHVTVTGSVMSSKIYSLKLNQLKAICRM